MEMALGPLCGEEDVVTPLRANQSIHIPRNYFQDTLIGRSYAKSKYVRKFINRHSSILGHWYYEHMPAIRVKELVGENIWNDYYKFCFERNPWDKVVSYYNWKKNGQKRKMLSFDEYVLNKTHRLPADSKLYCDDQGFILDDIFDYSNFIGSFNDVCKRLKIPFSGKMPQEKVGFNKKSADFTAYYDERTKEKISQVFNREIKLMQYTFNDLNL